MPKVETGASTSMNIDITCESCGKSYNATCPIEVSKTLLDEFNPRFDIREKLQQQISAIQAGRLDGIRTWHKCPQCDWTQSWNLNGARWTLAGKAGLAIGAVPAVLVLIATIRMISADFNLGLLLVPIITTGLTWGIALWMAERLAFMVLKNYDPNRKMQNVSMEE